MGNVDKQRVNISAPNLLNICVDEVHGGEFKGRLYHCYSVEPVIFSNIIQLLREAEKLFDEISFPQASTKPRSFVDKDIMQNGFRQRPQRLVTQTELIKHSGEVGTFITSVRFRQNSTWQGEMYWVEQDEMMKFSNTLDFIKGLDVALQ
jgi:hypothetical protein